VYICSKAIDRAYEEYVLTLGDFDERIFFGKDADQDIGTPSKLHSSPGINSSPAMDGPTLLLEAAARSNADSKLHEHMVNVCIRSTLDEYIISKLS